MGTGWRAGAGVVAVVGLLGGPVVATRADTSPSVLELRVITFASLDRADIDLARDTTQALLAPAGIQVAWRECVGDACSDRSTGGTSLLVRLLPIASALDPTAAGDVIRDAATASPSVLVYVARNIEVARAIRQSARGRLHPSLSTLSVGHVVGLTLAHEIGHSLGLPHSSMGPMKARPDAEDLLALRRSTLTFGPDECDAMRLALRAEPHPTDRFHS